MKTAELDGDSAALKRLKTENELHLRKAEVFHVQLQEATEQAKNMQEEKDVVVLAIDFQKNLPLWNHNFCIHECTDEKATMFLYAENYAGKGPNDVIVLAT